MQIHVIASHISDNYFCLLAADDGSGGVLIDPFDADTALAVAQEEGVHVTSVVNTHWHPDHTGGNAAVIAATGARLYVPHTERDIIPGWDETLQGGDTLQVGDTTLKVLDVPGHTHGHIGLYAPGHLFGGDVIFVAGAGHCRAGGDPATLFATFRDVLAALPEDTLLYPGHDYAVRDLEFALHLDPQHAAARSLLEQARQIKADGGYVQTTLGQERAVSPFFRWDDGDFRAALRTQHADAWAQAPADADDAARTFIAVRTLRNSW